MLIAPIEFRSFRSLNLLDLIGLNGVYVIWDSMAQDRPSYIGAGNLLKCLGEDLKNDSTPFTYPIEGFIAVGGGAEQESSLIVTKAIKHLLLDVASDINRAPKVSSHPELEALLRVLSENETLQVPIRGYDPFTAPRGACPMNPVRDITAWALDGEDYGMEHSRILPARVYRLPQKKRAQKSRLVSSR